MAGTGHIKYSDHIVFSPNKFGLQFLYNVLFHIITDDTKSSVEMSVNRKHKFMVNMGFFHVMIGAIAKVTSSTVPQQSLSNFGFIKATIPLTDPTYHSKQLL
uniref:Uncharacterized protein n=1 Tax=Glossina brevipalpis TaxID=37001 RepID=A0A1A9W5G3_9MUSC